MKTYWATLITIVVGLAACAEAPQPTMYLRPVRQVNLDLLPSRTLPHSLAPISPVTEPAL